ncbi:YqhG family protein [Paenibacillus hexagrammi]|uniref:YqhG family protein n=1 Tax=Paenibacillus hexagrammi TaxID=2908839 RepID=UPI0021A7C590|nr:YqhG family protein [Paenibacillus sp. YPD9-1]
MLRRGGSESILGRYFGFVPTAVTARVPQDELTFGSRRLEQLFGIVRQRGRFVHLFEEPFPMQAPSSQALIYDRWFCVNYKVELACDRKRSEIHSLGIQLNSGEIRENFHKQMLNKSLSPKLPIGCQMLPDTLTIPKAVNALEMLLERKISRYDHTWAAEANDQHRSEINRVESYYDGLLLSAEPEQRPEIELQCRNRLQEIDWQYKPRIVVSVINCGLFHLNSGRATRN